MVMMGVVWNMKMAMPLFVVEPVLDVSFAMRSDLDEHWEWDYVEIGRARWCYALIVDDFEGKTPERL